MPLDLPIVTADFARGIRAADARRPVAVNQRSGQAFRPGIGPHSEAAAVALVMEELRSAHPERYGKFAVGVPYPNIARQKCDLCLGETPAWTWALEVKLLRFLGDNGQPNDNILMHVLSPYSAHRSALTDCTKLLASGLAGRRAILIYGFEHDDWPLDLAVDAFELLARSRADLGQRHEAAFASLVHPVHSRGRVFAWELRGPVEKPPTSSPGQGPA